MRFFYIVTVDHGEVWDFEGFVDPQQLVAHWEYLRSLIDEEGFGLEIIGVGVVDLNFPI